MNNKDKLETQSVTQLRLLKFGAGRNGTIAYYTLTSTSRSVNSYRSCTDTLVQLLLVRGIYGINPSFLASLGAEAVGKVISVGTKAEVTDTIEQLTGKAPQSLKNFLEVNSSRFIANP